MNSKKSAKWHEDCQYSDSEWGKVYRIDSSYKSNEELDFRNYDYWFIGEKQYGDRGIAYEKSLNELKEKDFGIKVWEFKCGSSEHQPKAQRNATEYNFIIKGHLKGVVGNKDKTEIELKTGDFIVIKPGFVINLQKCVLADTTGITIKVPLFRNDEIKEGSFK